MTDDQRRRSGTTLDRRVTVLEVEMRTHLRASEQLHRDARDLLEKMDTRLDRQEGLAARLLGGLAVAMFLGQILAPKIAEMLGLTP